MKYATNTFLYDYRTGGAPAARLERVLAVGRAFLTVAGLIAIYLDPNQPVRLAALAYTVLLAYAAYSLIVLGVLHAGPPIRRAHSVLLHALDILWTSALTVVSEGPVSPFFLFFLFVVVSAAYRWGFRETVLTACVTVVIFLTEGALLVASPWHPDWLEEISFDLNSTILRVTYLLLTGFLLGYLAEQEKQFRAEAAAAAAAGRQPRIDLGFAGSVTAVAALLLRIFEASAIALVLREEESGRARVWRLDRDTSAPAEREKSTIDLTPGEEAEWFFRDNATAWDAVLARNTEATVARATEPDVWPLRAVYLEIPERVRSGVNARTVTAINMGLPGEWHGRAYLYNMPRGRSLERRLHLLEALAGQVVPALTNVFLMQRLHSAVSAAERARVARELHDGAIQALVGIQMSVQAMRRAPPGVDGLDHELGQIEALLQREVAALRHLMQALRPIEIDAGESLDAVLAGIIERFRCDSGIAARFVATGGAIYVRPAAALEVARITQEALMNVRKHSGARNVLVRLVHADSHYELSIEDDGRGFPFEGRLHADELEARRLGPAVIKERARMLQAALAVESTPGAGARVELRFREQPA